MIKQTIVPREKLSKKQLDLKQQLDKLNILRYEDYDTIKLINGKYIQTDDYFIQDVGDIASIRQNIIGNLIKFTRNQLTDQESKLHSDANTLNTNTSNDINKIDQSFRCSCGCNRAKGNNIHFCAPKQEYEILGPGVILFFMFLKYIIFGLIIFVLIFGIYAVTTNLLGQNVDATLCNQQIYCVFRDRVSDKNKVEPQIHDILQPYIGVAFCIFWIFLMRVIKFMGKKTNQRLDKRFKTASDFAIKIQNLPYGQYSQLEIISYFEKLWEKKYDNQEIQKGKEKSNNNNANVENVSQQIIDYDGSSDRSESSLNPFHMKSIQIVYNMEFSRKMIQQVFSQSLLVYSILSQDENKKRKIIDNPQEYRIRKNRLKQTYQLLQDLRKKFLNDGDFRKNISTTCAFIQFMTPHHKQLVLKHFGSEKMGLYKQLRAKLKSILSPSSKNILFKGKVLDIQRAPQPSDILWKNCQKKYSLMRKLAIYSITFFIILISFGLITGLNYAQEDVAIRPGQFQQSTLTIINYVISFSLMIVNQVLWLSLFFLLDLEYNHTLTEKIVSQMNKTLFASSINVIALPIISFYVIPQANPSPNAIGKYFQTQGVAGQVYDYHLSMLTAGLILRLLDPLNLLKRISLWIRKVRNLLIRFIASKIPDIQPQKGVIQINKFYEGDFFDIADLYVTAVGAILHVAFFVSLQPFILVIATLMLFLFYWIYKFKVFYVCKLPEMTDYLVFDTALTHAGYVPIIYGAGTIVNSYIVSLQTTRDFYWIGGVICIIIGVFAFFNPCDVLNIIVQKFIELCVKFKQSENEQANINETYYQDSNSLDLLGFQTILKGSSAKQLKNELKTYCQSFFRDYYREEVKKVGMDFIKKQIVNGNNKEATLLSLNMFNGVSNQNFIENDKVQEI